MKNKLLFIAFSFISLPFFSQNFEGYILYNYQYLDSKGNDVTEQVREEKVMQLHYYINDNNYKGIDDKYQLVQLYNARTNIYYYQAGNKFKFMNGGSEHPKDFNIESVSDTLSVLGYLCKSIIVKTEVGSIQYYYSDAIKTSVENFEKNRYNNWNNYLQATNGSIPIKYIITNEDGSKVVVTAIKVEEKNLIEDEFDIKKQYVIGK